MKGRALIFPGGDLLQGITVSIFVFYKQIKQIKISMGVFSFKKEKWSYGLILLSKILHICHHIGTLKVEVCHMLIVTSYFKYINGQLRQQIHCQLLFR